MGRRVDRQVTDHVGNLPTDLQRRVAAEGAVAVAGVVLQFHALALALAAVGLAEEEAAATVGRAKEATAQKAAALEAAAEEAAGGTLIF